MSFFANDAINRVNLQRGIQALAQGAGQLFLLVFLIRVGISVPAALLVQAGIVAGRFVLRPLILPLAIRLGLKPLLIAGTLGLAAQYPLVAEVQGLGAMLVAACMVAALGEVLYFVTVNAYFAALGDAEFRGHQVAAGQALAAAAGVVAPLAAASALIAMGPRWTFSGIAAIQILSVIPLLALPNVAVARAPQGAWRAARLAFALIATDGWFDAAFANIWQVWLFLALGQSYAAYGGAMALAGLAGAAFGLVVGRHVDLGHGRRSVALGYGAATLVVVLRAASLSTPWLAGAANALGGFVMPLLATPLSAATHNIAKAAPCPLRVKMATEGGWDVGCFAACLLAAAMARLGVAPWLSVLIALPALAGGAALLWRYYTPRT